MTRKKNPKGVELALEEIIFFSKLQKQCCLINIKLEEGR